MTTYRNTSTGQVITYPEASHRLGRLPQWELIADPDPETADTTVAERAAAERASIVAAAQTRADAATLHAEQAIAIAAASVAPVEGAAPPNQTFANATPPGHVASEGVLARAKADQASGVLQIGPHPEEHPRTDAELAAADAEASAAIKAGDEGVLDRADMEVPADDDAPKRRKAKG